MSHALDCQVFGLNPIGHHYTSLLFHLANAVLLFLLFRQATGFNWLSLFVAALFALHPVNVESVVWAAERKNVLSMFFFLLTLIVYDRYARRGGRYLYLLVTVLFALGLMAKSQIVTLPFVLLLWDYWPLERMSAPKGSLGVLKSGAFAYLVLEKLPLFVLAAADSAITLWAQRAGGSVRALAEVPTSVRLENAVVCYVEYIGKAFWPYRLAPLYPRPVSSLPIWQVVGAAAILLLASAVVWRWRDRRYLAVGWCWFLGTLVPMIGFITVGEQAMADRYAYIPFIGLFVAVVWGLNALITGHRISGVWPATAAVAVVLVLGCLTYRQIGYWRDSETLWRYTLSVTDRNYVAHNNLGVALAKQGRAEEAILEYRTGNLLHQYSPLPLLGLGYEELLLGHTQEAIKDCNTVLQESTDPKLQAAAWSEFGQAHMQLQHYDLATESYQKAFRLNPQDNGALVGTGLLALHEGKSDLAVTQFFNAVQVEPSDANVLLYEQALRRAGRSAEADSAAVQVQKVSSDLSHAHLEVGQLLSLAGLKPQ